MGLIDFSQFVNELATAVRAGDPAVLPLHASRPRTSRAAALFDPVTEADRAGEARCAS